MEFSAPQRAKEVSERHNSLAAEELMRVLYTREFPGRVALVSSFGAEAAILLFYAAKIDKSFPVVFLDTQKLFPETLEYRDHLVEKFSLTNVKTIYPDYTDITRSDPDGTLWQKNPRLCCTLRKVKPLQRALKNYDAWITGRKRYHGGVRSTLPLIEASDGKVKINPLADWTPEQIRAVFEDNGISYHPLALEGYTSIGCTPCTDIPKDAKDVRSGRWVGQNKTECGIHIEDGKIIRTNII